MQPNPLMAVILLGLFGYGVLSADTPALTLEEAVVHNNATYDRNETLDEIIQRNLETYFDKKEKEEAADVYDRGTKISIEAGATKHMFDDRDEMQWAFMASYIIKTPFSEELPKAGSWYFELFGGSLNGNRATTFVFGGFGYWYDYGVTDWARGSFVKDMWSRISIDVGYNGETSDHLSTHNMFSESVAIGYNDFYIAYRHMSNGSKFFNNFGSNRGEDIFTFGIIVNEF